MPKAGKIGRGEISAWARGRTDFVRPECGGAVKRDAQPIRSVAAVREGAAHLAEVAARPRVVVEIVRPIITKGVGEPDAIAGHIANARLAMSETIAERFARLVKSAR